MSKRLIIILISLGVIILIALVIIFAAASKRGPRVEVAQVVLGNIVSTVSASGVVRPATEVQISSTVAGNIEKLPVSEGDTVKKGDLLIQLGQQEYRAEVQRAQAALDLAQASLAQSRAQYERAKQLYKQDLIARQEFEAAQTQFTLDQARVREARANIEQAKRQLEQTTITAPISGTIIALNVEQGEQVIPGSLNVPGTVLMVIGNLSRMQVLADVSESEVAKINVGQPAVIEVDAFPNRKFEGSVAEVAFSPEATQGTVEGVVNYLVKVGFTDTVPELKPGMTAYADIITARKDSVLMIPIQAVITSPVEQLAPQFRGNLQEGTETQAVFIYESGVAYLAPVKTGIAGQEYIQVTGLKRGQEIISGPFGVLRELQSGERVSR